MPSHWAACDYTDHRIPTIPPTPTAAATTTMDDGSLPRPRTSSTRGGDPSDSNNTCPSRKPARGKPSRSPGRRSSSLLYSLATLILALFFFASTPTAHAETGIGGTKKLYTSSVAYCSPPQVLIVDNVQLTLYPENSTLEFDLAAASVANDVNVTIDVEVNAYGRSLVDFSLDLCTIAGGILCPLPTYQFNGGGVYPIPSSYLDAVPSIAYTVPDLEAVATLELTSSTGDVVGCVQVTLSNGHTAKQSAAKWAAVGVAFLALFSSLLHTVIAQSMGAAQWRVVDVFMSIQHIAITGLLSLNYPTVFISYAVNFAWSIGLADIPSLQTSITKTRTSTGGGNTPASFGSDLTAETARNAVVLLGLGSPSTDGISSSSTSLSFISQAIKRAKRSTGYEALEGAFASRRVSLGLLQPVSHYVEEIEEFTGAGISNANSLWKRAAKYAPNTGADGQPVQSSTGENLPVVSGNDTDYGGIDLFAQRVYIAPQNAFLTVLVSIFIFIAIIVGALVLTYAIATLFRLATSRRNGRVAHWSRRITRPSEFGFVVAATAQRTFMVILPVYFIFAFYQWRSGDSWVPDLLAGIFLVAFVASLLIFFLPTLLHSRRAGLRALYYGEDEAPVRASTPKKRWGHVVHPYRPPFFWFALAFVLMSVVRACWISFAQGHDFLQSVGLLVFEVVFFVLLCVLRIGRDKKTDFVLIVLTLFRIATWAVAIVFTRRANITWIPRVVVAFVQLVVTALPVVWLFFLTLLDLVSPFRRSKLRPNAHGDRYAPPQEQQYVGNNMEHKKHDGDFGAGAAAGAAGTAAYADGESRRQSNMTAVTPPGGAATMVSSSHEEEPLTADKKLSGSDGEQSRAAAPLSAGYGQGQGHDAAAMYDQQTPVDSLDNTYMSQSEQRYGVAV